MTQFSKEPQFHEDIFYDGDGRNCDLVEVVRVVHAFVIAKPKASYEIIVGTDSHASDTVSFVTAVTARRIGNGGIYFWTRSYKNKFPNLRERIYTETIQSIMLAQELRGRLQEVLHDEYFWNDQIHIDVGREGKTREFIDTVVGMVRGYGFEAVIKPDSFGAFVVADRHT